MMQPRCTRDASGYGVKPQFIEKNAIFVAQQTWRCPEIPNLMKHRAVDTKTNRVSSRRSQYVAHLQSGMLRKVKIVVVQCSFDESGRDDFQVVIDGRLNHAFDPVRMDKHVVVHHDRPFSLLMECILTPGDATAQVASVKNSPTQFKRGKIVPRIVGRSIVNHDEATQRCPRFDQTFDTPFGVLGCVVAGKGDGDIECHHFSLCYRDEV